MFALLFMEEPRQGAGRVEGGAVGSQRSSPAMLEQLQVGDRMRLHPTLRQAEKRAICPPAALLV